MDYGKSLNLPKTDFPMRANLPQREGAFLEKWEEMDIYNKQLSKNEGKPKDKGEGKQKPKQQPRQKESEE